MYSCNVWDFLTKLLNYSWRFIKSCYFVFLWRVSEKEVLAMQNKQCRRVNNVCGEDNGGSLCTTADWQWQKQGYPWEWGGLCWFPEDLLSLEPVKCTISFIKSPNDKQNYSWSAPCDQTLRSQAGAVSYSEGSRCVWPWHRGSFSAVPCSSFTQDSFLGTTQTNCFFWCLFFLSISIGCKLKALVTTNVPISTF